LAQATLAPDISLAWPGARVGAATTPPMGQQSRFCTSLPTISFELQAAACAKPCPLPLREASEERQPESWPAEELAQPSPLLHRGASGELQPERRPAEQEALSEEAPGSAQPPPAREGAPVFREVEPTAEEQRQAAAEPALADCCGQTVTVFDWDDTLLCTTWLSALRRRCRAPSAAQRQELWGIGLAARQLLQKAQEAGHVVIITNSAIGWVEHSAAMHVPELLPLLKGVHIISARSEFSQEFPEDAARWKLQAFLTLQQRFLSRPISNLISIGDSSHEVDAARALGRRLECDMLVKTVKFCDSPNPEQLRKQLELVCCKLDTIVACTTDISVTLERRPA